MSNHLPVLAPGYAWYQDRAAARQRDARAEGTERGRRASVKQYLTFCYQMFVDPLAPKYQDLCGWIEDRAARHDKPHTIRNKLSHLRTYAGLVGVSLTPFLHPRVSRAVDALLRNKNYTHRKTPAMPLRHIREVLLALPDTRTAQAVRVALLLMYHAALRQSEVLPPSIRAMDCMKHPTRADISINRIGMTLKVKWAKNLQGYNQDKLVHLHRAKDRQFCVVAAMERHILQCPTKSPQQPLIVFPESSRPIPVTFARRTWSQALRATNLQGAAYTLHSLRRAAATQAHLRGCSELDIQAFGGWRSNAHRVYVKKTKSRAVNKIICEALCK